MWSRARDIFFTSAASDTLEHSIRLPPACSSSCLARRHACHSSSAELTKTMRQSFVSDTQPTRVIAPALRCPAHRRKHAPSPNRRSKKHFKLFAATWTRSHRCIQQRKLTERNSTNLRVAVRTSNESRCAFVSTTSQRSDPKASSSRTTSTAPSTFTRAFPVHPALTSELWRRTLENVCTLALT